MKNKTHDKTGQTLKSRDVEIALYEVQSVWERRGIIFGDIFMKYKIITDLFNLTITKPVK